MPIRAVVFDLDGLMFNTEMIYDQVGDELLRRRGKLMTADLKLAMIGRRAQESLTFMIDMHGLTDTVDQLLEESHVLFFETAADRLAPMPGLHELLEFIETHQLPKGVATSSSHGYVQRVVGPFGLLPRFNIILASEDVSQGKPHPEVLPPKWSSWKTARMASMPLLQPVLSPSLCPTITPATTISPEPP